MCDKNVKENRFFTDTECFRFLWTFPGDLLREGLVDVTRYCCCCVLNEGENGS